MASERPTLYRHPARPEWGRGLLEKEGEGKLILHWEDGAEHVVRADYRDRLEKLHLGDDETERVVEGIRGLQSKAQKAKDAASKRRTSTPTKSASPRMAFEEQLQRFERRFPGGFVGDVFITRERGVSGGGKIDGYKQNAIEVARETLAPAAFDDAAAVFESAGRLIALTNLVHPNEGSIRFKTIAPGERPTLVERLRDLLHGSGDEERRFDQFVAALTIRAKDGSPARPTWPLATIFGALFDPITHVFVKPKLMQEQAVIIDGRLTYTPLPSGAVYAQFRDIAFAVSERLLAAGHQPRDLMDVATFVWTTLSVNSDAAPA